MYPRYGQFTTELMRLLYLFSGFDVLYLISHAALHFVYSVCQHDCSISHQPLCFSLFVPLFSAVLGGTVRDKHTAAFVIVRILFSFGTKTQICRSV